MVSRAKPRTSGFSNLQEEVHERKYDANADRRVRGRVESKYAGDDDKRRLRQVVDRVKQSLEPFYRAGQSSILPDGVPAAETIRTFLDQTSERSRRTVVDLTAFRKCLYALGVSSDDTAFLLDNIDRQRTGSMDRRAFGAMFLPIREKSTAGVRRRFPGYSNPSDDDDDMNIDMFHRKVLERVLVKYANVKDAFRQYDTGRAGVLTIPQFRMFLRDVGYVGSDVDALIRHLDRNQQRGISFRAFANVSTAKSNVLAYSKPSPKRPTVAPLPTFSDPIEAIRTKLRQRVIGRNKSIREVFMEFDADGNGYLDHGEFHKFMTAYGFPLDETRMAIAFLDQDGSGTIDYDEFASGLLFYRPNVQRPQNEDERQQQHGEYLVSLVREKLATVSGGRRRIENAFNQFDADGSGALDYREFSAFLTSIGIQLSPRDLDTLMRVVDTDESKQIEYQEFVSIFGTEESLSPEVEAPFARYDLGNSGQLDASEFSQPLKDHGVGERDIRQTYKQVGAHRNGLDSETINSSTKSREWPIEKSTVPAKTAVHSRVETSLVQRILHDQASLEAAFRQHDTDGSGELEHDEFRRFMKHYGVRDDHEIARLIAELDADSSGTISLDEFLARFQPKRSHAIAKPRALEDSAVLRELKQVWVEEVVGRMGSLEHAFREHDQQQRGELEYEQMRDLLGQFGISDDHNVRVLLSQLDTDNSGGVSLEQFLSVFGSMDKKTRPIKRKPQRTKVKPVQRGAKSLAATQAATSAARLRLLEEQWIEKALATHGSVRAAFDHFDVDASGALDHDEFRQLMTTFGITRDDDIASMIRRLDVDGSGTVDFDEFATLFHEGRVALVHRKSRSPSLMPIHHETLKRTNDSHAARLRELELKWIKRALSCHASIEAAFAEYDRDGNGTLDHDEFAHCMKRYGIVQDEDIARLIRRLDLDDSGTIDLHEFTTVFNALRCNDVSRTVPFGTDSDVLEGDELQSVLEIERELADRILQHTRDMRQAFRKFDLNGNGRLEYSEFRRVLKSYKFPEPEIRKVIRHLDRDVSGFIDYREFISGLSSDGGTGKKGSVISLGTTTKGAAKKPKTRAKSSRRLSANPVPPETLRKALLERLLATHGTVQSTFRKYDTERSGSLGPRQFETMVVDLGFTQDDASVLMEIFDADQSGTIEYEEFLSRLIAEEN